MIQIGKYKHYKGKEYEVIGFAHHSESKEKMVLYKPLYDVPDLNEMYNNNIIFTRPYNMFNESILLNGKKTKRFALISPQNKCQP